MGAVNANSLGFAKLLLNSGNPPAEAKESDDKGVSVLHTACFNDQPDICQLLLKARADANFMDRHGQTPLFFASSAEICQLLCDAKANPNALNHRGQSACHHAARGGLKDVIVAIATHRSADPQLVDLKDKHGADVAYYARQAGIVFNAQKDIPGWTAGASGHTLSYTPKQHTTVSSAKPKPKNPGSSHNRPDWKPAGWQAGWPNSKPFPDMLPQPYDDTHRPWEEGDRHLRS